jgi:hypothetical protein
MGKRTGQTFPKKKYKWPISIWRNNSTSLAHIKTAFRFHFTPVRMAITKKTKNKKCSWGCEKKKAPLHTVGCFILYHHYNIITIECKLYHHYRNQYRGSSRNRKQNTLCSTWAYTWSSQTAHNRDTCTPTSITAIFTIAKLRNQPPCASTDECIKKM